MPWEEAELAGLLSTLVVWLAVLLLHILKVTVEPPPY